LVVTTSAAIAVLFMFFERDALRRFSPTDLIAPWDRAAVWRGRRSTALFVISIFVVSTAVSCGAQAIGYVLASFL
jgi:hypothetical protein